MALLSEQGRGFDVDRYLRRIGLTDRPPVSATGLRDLQLAHLCGVPFENLHVYARRGVDVDVESSYRKIVEQRRGGWCFELNGCFGELLRRLGFDLDLVSCRVHDAGTGELGPPLDHLALLVRLDGRRWLTDVGFGDSPLVPLDVDDDGLVESAPRPARIVADGPDRALHEVVDGVEVLQYVVDLRPRGIEEFRARSTYLQTEPGLVWTAKPFATRATSAAGARVWLLADRLKRRTDEGVVTTLPVAPGLAWSEHLREHVGIDQP